ncbi:MAG: glycoside hydrolase family 97 catalytic domain-containing protein [Mucilaginibacter sp.]|uniref:glycoside hydrolase family 97 protein n=1 Tax=Mucilaginibacter sp. TaxID=1882438 RepID=UPI003264C6B4
MNITNNKIVCRIILLSLFLFFMIFIPVKAKGREKVIAEVTSLDSKSKATFALNEQNQLLYRLSIGGKTVLNWSRLGLETDQLKMDLGISIESVDKIKHTETFKWPLGENSVIENYYNEIILNCRTSDVRYMIIARMYNGSLAFKYICKDLKGRQVRLKQELTTFNLTVPFTIYQYHEESIFRPLLIDSLQSTSDLPSTLAVNGGFISIGEAENRNYTKCVLVKGTTKNSLKLNFYTDTLYRDHKVSHIQIDTLVLFKDSLVTPWRTISYANSAIELHNFSELNLKLVTPLNQEVPLNIKPGKVFRVQLSTQAAMDGVDLAAKMNFQYIMLDGGWYGSEWNMSSDPTQPIPAIDMPKIVSYAKDKGVDVILYVGYNQLRTRLETFLPVFKNWGIKGIKFGFVDGGTQKGLSWLDSTIAKVSAYGFVINVHDHYKPTGLARRYPFQLSQEGIRGDENSPDAFHNTVLPYTRFLAGAADFTFCYPNATNAYSKNVKVSKGQQLALTVVYFDPLQAMFWYGRPLEYDPEGIDVEFFKYVPTVWDESKYLAGDIGKSITVARRKGDVWYLGSVSGLTDQSTQIKLDFIEKGKKYDMVRYKDDGKRGIQKDHAQCKFGDSLQLSVSAKGGEAIILKPVN